MGRSEELQGERERERKKKKKRKKGFRTKMLRDIIIIGSIMST